MLMYHANVCRQAARNTNHRDPVALSHLRNPHRDFAVDGLAVDTPFTGNDQIRIRQQRIKVQRFGDNINPRTQLCAAKSVQRGAHSPRGTTAFQSQHVEP